jgi:hypothetical protein
VDIAALIVSVLSLILSILCGSMMLAQRLSKHTIQYVPLEPPTFGDLGHGGPSSPLDDPFRDISQPLTPEEQEYFSKQNKKG